MDFGFMRASNTNYTRPNLQSDRVVHSYDGYNSYLLVVDDKSAMTWVFLTRSKEPPLTIVRLFLQTFGRPDGGFMIRCDQGGELGRSPAFVTMCAEEFRYYVEPTGADSASQNGQAEKWNDVFAITTRALLYGAALGPSYWSAALLHGVYLHNRRVHSRTGRTPFESWWGSRPNLRYLKLFGSRVCVKQTGDRRAKLDKHDFTGLFLGYTSTDQNIRYLDIHSGLTKTSHHAIFDEAWYLQDSRPPAAQLLYDLGLEDEPISTTCPPAQPIPPALWPPERTPAPSTDISAAIMAHIPTRLSSQPATIATTHRVCSVTSATAISLEYNINPTDMAQVYVSPSPYNDAFDEVLDLRKFNIEQSTERLACPSSRKTAGSSSVPWHRPRLAHGSRDGAHASKGHGSSRWMILQSRPSEMSRMSFDDYTLPARLVAPCFSHTLTSLTDFHDRASHSFDAINSHKPPLICSATVGPCTRTSTPI